MSLTGQYTSVYKIIESVYRDAGYSKIDFADTIEWVGDCMRLIGVPMQYVDKTTNGQDNAPDPLLLADYRAELPTDLVSIVSMRYIELDDDDNIKLIVPMVEATDTFYKDNSTNIRGGYNNYWNPTYTYETIEDGEITESTTVTQSYESARTHLQPIRYKLNDTFIITEVKDGYIELSYKAFPVDEDGLPMIPKDIKFEQAVKSYIQERMDYKAWRRGDLAGAVYQNSQQERNFYMGAAKTGSHIPSIDEMEALKNQFLRLIPKTGEHNNSFNTASLGERKYNGNSYYSRRNRY